MSDDKRPSPPAGPSQTREQRLARALRENLRRRKAPAAPTPGGSEAED
jgi:hypothetical protein